MKKNVIKSCVLIGLIGNACAISGNLINQYSSSYGIVITKKDISAYTAYSLCVNAGDVTDLSNVLEHGDIYGITFVNSNECPFIKIGDNITNPINTLFVTSTKNAEFGLQINNFSFNINSAKATMSCYFKNKSPVYMVALYHNGSGNASPLNDFSDNLPYSCDLIIENPKQIDS